MVRISCVYCISAWAISVLGAAVIVLVLTVFGTRSEAQAQYRAGSFVDGQPVFARPRSSGRIMRLRGRRSGRRAGRRRGKLKYRKPRQNSVRTALPVVARPILGEGRRSVSLPPLPSRGALARLIPEKLLTAAKQRAITRKSRQTVKRKKVLQIVVSLGRQRMTVYQDGRQISRSSVSSGKAGHRTPTGVFSIIQKRRYHRSNIYSGAPMPYMQRITWSGIALHEGRLPGYAASHGCVRLPSRFARQLFKTTKMRTHVVVTDGNPVPRMFSHSNLPAAADLDDLKLAVLAGPPVELLPPAESFASWPAWSMRVPVNFVSGENRDAEVQRYDADVYTLAAMLHFDQSEMIAHRRRVTRTRSSTPLRVLVTRRTQRDHNRDVQRQLVVLGYDTGGLDGQLGRQTIAAIKAFQSARNLRVTGYPDATTRDLLDITTELPRPSAGTVYVRQNGRQIYSGPIEFARPSEPVGTHLYSLIELNGEAGAGTWTAMTVQSKGRLPSWSKRSWRKRLAQIDAVDARQAIGRVAFPAHVRAVIEDRLTPGSSLIIADRGSERETGLATDFVVLTD